MTSSFIEPLYPTRRPFKDILKIARKKWSLRHIQSLDLSDNCLWYTDIKEIELLVELTYNCKCIYLHGNAFENASNEYFIEFMNKTLARIRASGVEVLFTKLVDASVFSLSFDFLVQVWNKMNKVCNEFVFIFGNGIVVGCRYG